MIYILGEEESEILIRTILESPLREADFLGNEFFEGLVRLGLIRRIQSGLIQFDMERYFCLCL